MIEPTTSQKNRSFDIIRFIIGLITIFCCSIQVIYITTYTFDHSRNFIRSMHYYILGHTDSDIYWAGQTLLNYPIHECFVLQQVTDLLDQYHQFLGNLEDYSYGIFNQEQFNQTQFKIFVQKNSGIIQEYNWTIQQGFNEPFNISDIQSVKKCLVDAKTVRIPVDFIVGEHQWKVVFLLQPFSQSSIITQLFAQQQIPLLLQHISTIALGLILICYTIYKHDYYTKQSYLPDYILIFLLIFSGLLAISGVPSNTVVMIDGLTCLIAWLWILKIFTRQDDYHISFLIKKSYILVGKLFLSFGPVFIGFCLLAFTIFCRYTSQFSSFWKTTLQLFYICYYNMTYESFIVTSRANPIAIIFFLVFTVLFTICVYSAMLVSVFCSYVWNKKEKKLKQQILNNLKIQCSSCNFKYKYKESLPKNSRLVTLTQFLHIDWEKPQEASKFKEVLIDRTRQLNQKVLTLLDEMSTTYLYTAKCQKVDQIFKQECWAIKKKVSSLQAKCRQL